MATPEVNCKLLKSQMVLNDITPKSLMLEEEWSKTTTYRKLAGGAPWSGNEMRIAKELLGLSDEMTTAIFCNAWKWD